MIEYILDQAADNADYILASANVVFDFALLPTVAHQFRVKASTVPLGHSLGTASMVAVICVVFAALGLWFTLATDLVNLGLWLVIAVQRIVYGAPNGGTND